MWELFAPSFHLCDSQLGLNEPLKQVSANIVAVETGTREFKESAQEGYTFKTYDMHCLVLVEACSLLTVGRMIIIVNI